MRFSRYTSLKVLGLLAFLSILGGLVPTAASASPGQRAWVARYEPGYEIAGIVASPDGARVFVTGTEYGEDFGTVAYDSESGAQLWARTYQCADESFNYAHAIAVSPDGTRVFAAGECMDEWGHSEYDYATVAYDAATGAQLWDAGFRRPGEGDDVASALGMSPDGTRLYVTGTSSSVDGDSVGYNTLAYDAATGARLWLRRNDDGGASALGVAPDGSRVFVTGTLTFAYDAVTGATLWVRRNRPGRALGVSPDGTRVFISDQKTVALDASTGAFLWSGRYGGRLGVSSDGTSVYAAGTMRVAYDALTGTRLWTRGNRFGVSALGVAPDGTRVYVTGAATVAYDAATGAKLWKRPQGDALAVSPDGGRIYVAESGDGYVTVAYDTA